VGFVAENCRIFPTVTVRQNRKIARKGSGKGTDGWTLDRIYQHVLRLNEIEERRGEAPSGGEQQMLTIAPTLWGNPDLVLLDERTEG
jgi:ABC-type branched-subunit amino acid transport system ATPase component